MNINQLPTAYQPEGALGGIFAGINAANAQTANDLGFEESILANLVKQKEAAVAQQQMNSAPWMQSQIDKDVGAANKAMVEGDVALATKEGQIKAKNTGFDLDSKQNQFKALVSDLESKYMNMNLLAKMNENMDGNSFTYALKTQAENLGLDPREVQALIQMPPENRTDFILSRLHQARTILKQSPDILKKIAEEEGKEEAKAPMEREKLRSQELIQDRHDKRALQQTREQVAGSIKAAEVRSKVQDKIAFEQEKLTYKQTTTAIDKRVTEINKSLDGIIYSNAKPGSETAKKRDELKAEREALKAEKTNAQERFDAAKASYSGGEKPTTATKTDDGVIDADALLAARKTKQTPAPQPAPVAVPPPVQAVAPVQQAPVAQPSPGIGLKFQPKYTKHGFQLSDGSIRRTLSSAIAAQTAIEEAEARNRIGPFGVRPSNFQEVGE